MFGDTVPFSKSIFEPNSFTIVVLQRQPSVQTAKGRDVTNTQISLYVHALSKFLVPIKDVLAICSLSQ